jgi:hypothetical protein
VSPFLRQAEVILETAVFGSQEFAIVLLRQGGVRMIDPIGWSLPAMRVEFGAAAVYKVERRGAAIRVEGWDGVQSCRLEKMPDPEPRAYVTGRRELALAPPLECSQRAFTLRAE